MRSVGTQAGVGYLYELQENRDTREVDSDVEVCVGRFGPVSGGRLGTTGLRDSSDVILVDKHIGVIAVDVG